MDNPYQGSADVHVLRINAYVIMAEEPVLIDSGVDVDAGQFWTR